MTESPSGSGGLSSGDPLGGDAPEPPRHESGLPGAPPAPERPSTLPGYGSPPPPGAGGPIAPPAYGGVMGQFVLATWLSRVGAQLIDGLIIGVGALVLFVPIGAALGVAGASNSNTGIGAAIVGLLFWVVCVTVVAFLYAPVLMARTNGKTLGRMAMNIRVVRTSGEPVTFGFAMVREVVVKTIGFGIAGSFTVGLAPLLDYLWPLWDEENRALHDFIVNTRVVND
ncbi:MAG: RDD family protein [Solirubrobacteraceae bacterium]